LEKDSLFGSMIMHFSAISELERCNCVFSVPFSCQGLKKLGVLFSEFNPSNSATLLPVGVLVLQEGEEMGFDNPSEVLLRGG
jgi:hypothetical protein